MNPKRMMVNLFRKVSTPENELPVVDLKRSDARHSQNMMDCSTSAIVHTFSKKRL